ncbi:MAG: D-threo-aldose 1-dehydrogenase [Frankiales bacterium]|jgi:D-threo-aldose 1-dehydrogenase|nr:D-threo-aldose 1-dehydrogenase [Frankiales bacterium]
MSLPAAAVGSTGIRLTSLGFGAAPIANLFAAVDEQIALATVDAAWDGGIRYFDTAPHYGLGLSELRLGKALRARPRDEFVLSTKVGRLLEANPHPTGSDLADGGFDVPDDYRRVRDYTRDGVLRSIDASLGRLGLDRLDIVYIHDPEDFMAEAITEAAPALSALRDQGVIGAYGAGMNSSQPLQRLVAETDLDVVMVAGRWTLLDRTALPLLDQCRQQGVAVVAAAPFNSGLLASPSPGEESTFDYGLAPAALLSRARAMASECRRRGLSLPQAALQFPLRHPAVVSVVAGMKSPAEATADVALAVAPVPPPAWAALEEQLT